MSLEKNIESIAKSLEKIATALESRASAGPLTNGVSGGTAAVAQTAATPVAQAAVAAPAVQAAAAPQVALVAAAPVQAAPVATSFDTTLVAQAAALPPINTPEEMNALLVVEFNRLGAVHGENARNLIVAKLKEVGGSESVQGIAPANYPAVLAAVKALV